MDSSAPVDDDPQDVRTAFAYPRVERDELVVRALGKAALLFSFLLIYFCGYFPFDFSFAGNPTETIHAKLDVSRQQFYTAGDTRDNILFFMPLGFALALLTRGHVGIPRRLNAWVFWAARVLGALLFGGFISTLVELGQCFLGDRDPSLVDIVNNALGTAIAYGGVGILGTFLLPPAVWLLHRWGLVIGWRTLAVCSVVWTVAAVLPLLYTRDFGDLVRWDPRFLVTAGGSYNTFRPRPWLGTVKEILLADRAVSDAEAERLLSGPLDAAVPDVFGKDLAPVKTWFDLTRPWPIIDRTGNTPPLDYLTYVVSPEDPRTLLRPTTLPSTQPSPAGVKLDGRVAFLASEGPAEAANAAIKNASQFTFVSSFATAELFQHLSARVVTVSDERLGNNFTIGQDLFDLAIRLRARVTARSGQAPQIMVSDVFRDTKPKRVLVAYSPWKIRVFVEGMGDTIRKSEVTFTPEAALMWQLYPRPIWKFRLGTVGTSFYRSVYRCLIFAPLGLLLAMAVKLAGLRTGRRLLVVFAGAAAACAVFEWVGSLVGIVGFRPSGVAVCLLSAAMGAALVRFRPDARDPENQG